MSSYSYNQLSSKPKSLAATARRMARYLGSYKFTLLFVFFMVIISVAASIAANYVFKPLMNDYVVPLIGHKDPNLAGLARVVAIMAVIYAAGTLAGWAYSRVILTASTGTVLRLRCDLFDRMRTLPIRYFDTHAHGEIMSRFTNDTDAINLMISQCIPELFNSALSVVGVVVCMLLLSPVMTAFQALIVVVMLVASKKIGGGSAKYFKAQQEQLGAVNGYIEEIIDGEKVVKVFTREDEANAEFAQLNEALCRVSTKANIYANILFPCVGNLGNLQYALTGAVGALLAIRGMLDIGTLTAFILFSRNLFTPISQFSQQVNTILAALSGAERIFRFLDEEPEHDEGTVICEGSGQTREWVTPDGGRRPVAGEIVLRDVRFAYEPEKSVLRGISCAARPGQKIAIVGSTGAGKTTITNLINRFYDIDAGEITFDGIPIRQIRKPDLRGVLSMVLQDTHLFSGTVRENIRYGRLDASDEAVEQAAKRANADFFIRHLPRGYDTVLTADGANLSQGQRQLLAIARAAVADPAVLILDEATSSVDTRTEALIEQGMDQLMENRTVFVIAHRLSTVRNADEILVIEHGEIIERGSHDVLLARGGRYYSLYMGMFELS